MFVFRWLSRFWTVVEKVNVIVENRVDKYIRCWFFLNSRVSDNIFYSFEKKEYFFLKKKLFKKKNPEKYIFNIKQFGLTDSEHIWHVSLQFSIHIFTNWLRKFRIFHKITLAKLNSCCIYVFLNSHSQLDLNHWLMSLPNFSYTQFVEPHTVIWRRNLI